jgi:uncharacterized protein YcsI (UPF0317 family)
MMNSPSFKLPDSRQSSMARRLQRHGIIIRPTSEIVNEHNAQQQALPISLALERRFQNLTLLNSNPSFTKYKS